MSDVARAVAVRRAPSRTTATIGALALAAGVVVFGFYVLYNIPVSGNGG